MPNGILCKCLIYNIGVIEIMAKKVTEDMKEKILEYYNEGKTNKFIGEKLGICQDTVRKILRSMGIEKKSYINRLSEYELNEVCELYLQNRFDDIYKKYPFLNKDRVYHIASYKNIRKDSYFWTKEEVDLLIKFYNKITLDELYCLMNNRHSKRAITTKAIKLNLTKPQEWTEDEIKILKENYSYVTTNEILKLIPTRTINAIVMKAGQLGIKSLYYLNERYSNDEKQFIKDNFGKLTDEEIAKHLGKTVNGIRDQRYSLGLLYLKKDYSNYINFMKLFRGHIYNWKKESMEKCNYSCIITGSKEFDVHHLYGFNLICNEAFDKLSKMLLLKSDNINDYSKEELDDIIKIFLDVHNSYPLGICIRKDIHEKFHNIYGAGGNTPQQWDMFIKKYIKDII